MPGAGSRSLEIIYDYLNQMRELGIYKNSTIIITTDHGYSGGGSPLDLPHGTAVPIFIVKPSGLDNQAIQFSEAPISHHFRKCWYILTNQK